MCEAQKLATKGTKVSGVESEIDSRPLNPVAFFVLDSLGKERKIKE